MCLIISCLHDTKQQKTALCHVRLLLVRVQLIIGQAIIYYKQLSYATKVCRRVRSVASFSFSTAVPDNIFTLCQTDSHHARWSPTQRKKVTLTVHVHKHTSDSLNTLRSQRKRDKKRERAGFRRQEEG